ncbi:iron-hydroxamate ABC transporter substrate-binding protein [Gracilibacillus alcaliphilus]|uniref:iron-hydroxamate ABC transporter substrate-binding protein n=1 Tax=Gracilibacillus alcaliphilus TaxID=1401441 RepID=UPI00195F024E|nr:iron-hydroxamate ABC transporter substrate-binding protein [Gracilibacillus alcaliphilus]MBM7677583.1 iron complex transport system substrate-binding protein [Gracilibacillus alcaliphilus]
MNKLVQKKYLLLFILTSLLLLAACGNNDSESDDSNTSDDSNEATTEETTDITVDSDMGEVTVPANPEKVLASYNEDTLIALGVKPVAKWAIGESIQDYLEADLADVDTIEWTLPLEEVLSIEPDLIILDHVLDNYEGSYEDYAAIAPTYVLSEEEENDWKVRLQKFGELLGKEEEAEQTLADYDKKVSAAKEELDELLGDESVAMMWVVGGKYFLFEENRHSANMIYNELDVEVPGLVQELGQGEEAWNPIALEKLSEIDADHMIILGYENDEGIEALKDSSVWNNTDVVKNDHVYYIEDESNWTNSGLVASEQTIDMFLELFK